MRAADRALNDGAEAAAGRNPVGTPRKSIVLTPDTLLVLNDGAGKKGNNKDPAPHGPRRGYRSAVPFSPSPI